MPAFPKKKQKRNVSAKQLANLKPIKKGEVRNPEGGRAQNPLVKALAKINVESFAKVLEIVLTGNAADLQAILDDPTSPNILVGVAGAFQKAIEQRDYSLIERLAERFVGRVPDRIDMNSNVNNQISVIDHEKLKAALIKVRSDV